MIKGILAGVDSNIFQHITYVVDSFILILIFHIEDLDGVGDKVNIFLSPKLPLYNGSRSSMILRRWYIALDRNMLTTYAYIVYLLQRQ